MPHWIFDSYRVAEEKEKIVIEYNVECSGEKYRKIACTMYVADVDKMSQEEYRTVAIETVKKLSADVGNPAKLGALKEENLDFLAESAYADASRLGNRRIQVSRT